MTGHRLDGAACVPGRRDVAGARRRLPRARFTPGRLAGTLLLIAAAAMPVAAQQWNDDLVRQARALLADDRWFAAAIVQDGGLYPVANNAIVLRPAPFAIVIVTHEPDGVLMNASVRPDIYRGVVKKRRLAEILDEPDMFMGMAEGLFNDERTLYVSEVMPHFLFYYGPGEHRYDQVHLIDGAVVGHRLVEHLWDIEGNGFGGPGGPGGVIDMSDMTGHLYLSFFSTSWEASGRVEHQSAAVDLEFR